MEKSLEVGTAKVDVTPPHTIPYLGFVPRQGYFEGVHDPLYARAAVIGDGTSEVAVVSVDSLGYSDLLVGRNGGLMEELGARVKAAAGIPPENLLVSATHAHSTPETCCITAMESMPAVRAWFQAHLDQIASAVAMAARRRRRCRLKAGSIQARGIAWNRRILGRDGRLYAWHVRPPDDQIVDWGANDHEVGVWLFESVDDEEPVCTFVNFACHPTTVQVQPLVSADFPGLAMRIVEEELGGVALFLQGMCGNVRPVSTEHGFRDVRRHGLALGGAVLHLAGILLQRDRSSAGTGIRVAIERVFLPTRRDGPGEEELMKEILELSSLERMAAHEGNEAARRNAAGKLRLAQDRMRMVHMAREWPTMQADVWACRIGDAAMVGLAGEPFVEYGLRLKEISPARQTMTLGYINNWVGYLPNAQAYERGGYEPSYGPWTRLAPGAGEQLTAVAERLLLGLWR